MPAGPTGETHCATIRLPRLHNPSCGREMNHARKKCGLGCGWERTERCAQLERCSRQRSIAAGLWLRRPRRRPFPRRPRRAFRRRGVQAAMQGGCRTQRGDEASPQRTATWASQPRFARAVARTEALRLPNEAPAGSPGVSRRLFRRRPQDALRFSDKSRTWV